jgi:hypothetical protein
MSASGGMIKGKKPYASRGVSFSSFRLRPRPGCGARLAGEADMSGRQYRAWASSDRLPSNPAARSDGVLEYWSTAPSPNCARVAGKGCPMGRFDSGICPQTMATNIIQPTKDAFGTSSYRPYGTGAVLVFFQALRTRTSASSVESLPS